MTDIKPIKANVRYKEGNKWKERIAILKRLSPVADCLFIFLQKFKTNTTFEMEICLRDMCGMEVSTRQKGFVLHIVCLNAVHTFDFLNAKIRDMWMTKIKNEMPKVIQFAATLEKISLFSKLSRCTVNIHIHHDNVAIVTQQTFKSCVKLLVSWKLGDIKKHGLVNDKYYIVLSSYNNAEQDIITLSHLSFLENKSNENVINSFTDSLAFHQSDNFSPNKSTLVEIKFPGNKLSNLIESRNPSRKASNYTYSRNGRNNGEIFERSIEYAIISSKRNISNNISSSMESNYSEDHPRHFANTLPPRPFKKTNRRLSADTYLESDYVRSKPSYKNKPLNNILFSVANKKTVSCVDLATCKEINKIVNKENEATIKSRQPELGLNESSLVVMRLSKSLDELKSAALLSQNIPVDSISPKLNAKIKIAKTSLSSDNYLSMTPSELSSPTSKNIPSRTSENSHIFATQRNSIDFNGYTIMTGRIGQDSSHFHNHHKTLGAISDSNLNSVNRGLSYFGGQMSMTNDLSSTGNIKTAMAKKLGIFKSFRRRQKKLEMLPSGRDIDYCDTPMLQKKGLSYSESARRKFFIPDDGQQNILGGLKAGSDKFGKKSFSLRNYLPGVKYFSEPRLASVKKYSSKQSSLTLQRPRSGKEYFSRLRLQNIINPDFGSVKNESRNANVLEAGTPIFRSNFFNIASPTGRIASFDGAFIASHDDVVYSRLLNHSLDSSDGEPTKDVDHINYEQLDVTQSLKQLQSIWPSNCASSDQLESQFTPIISPHSKPQLFGSKSSDFINDNFKKNNEFSIKKSEEPSEKLFSIEAELPQSDDAVIYAQMPSSGVVTEMVDQISNLEDLPKFFFVNNALSNLNETKFCQDLPPRIKPKSTVYKKHPPFATNSRSLPKSLYIPTNMNCRTRRSTMPIASIIPVQNDAAYILEDVEYSSINFSDSQLPLKSPTTKQNYFKVDQNKDDSKTNFIYAANKQFKNPYLSSYIKKNCNTSKSRINEGISYNSMSDPNNFDVKLTSYATNHNLINEDEININFNDVNYTRIDEAKTKALNQVQRR